MATGDKMILFTQFKPMIHLLEKNLRELNIDFMRMDGDVAPIKREKLLDDFKT